MALDIKGPVLEKALALSHDFPPSLGTGGLLQHPVAAGFLSTPPGSSPSVKLSCSQVLTVVSTALLLLGWQLSLPLPDGPHVPEATMQVEVMSSTPCIAVAVNPDCYCS